jgi:hypothetical protein
VGHEENSRKRKLTKLEKDGKMSRISEGLPGWQVDVQSLAIVDQFCKLRTSNDR